MRYILELTKRATLDGSPEGVGHEFDATEAGKRHFVDNLKIARVVSEVDSGGRVSAPTSTVDVPDDIGALAYNELRQLAADLGVGGTGKHEEILARVAEHLGRELDEEE